MEREGAGSGRRFAAGAAGVFAVVYAGWILAVAPFRIPYHYWQLLPAPALEGDLWSALSSLHAQPPALNLLLGALLRGARATGLPAETLGALAHLGLGAATAAGLALLAARLLPRPAARWAVLALVLANPYLYGSFAQLFYTPLETALLTALALLALRHFEAPSPGRLAAALAPGLALVATRSLFHPLWLLLVAALLLLGAPPPRRARRRFAAVLAVAAALLLAWPAKNLVRFGFLGYSSWAGFNLARGLPLSDPTVEILRRERVGPRLSRRLARQVPPEHRGDPALADAAKPDGSPNWNHFAVLAASRRLARAARAHLAEHPEALLARAARFYLDGFATYEGRDPYSDVLAVDILRKAPERSDVAPAAGWLAAYERLVFQRFRPPGPAGHPRVTTGFAFAFPVLLALPLGALWVRRRRPGPAGKTVALLVLCVAWVLAAALLVDGFEGNRMRFSTEPFLFLGAAYALAGTRARAGSTPPPPALPGDA